LSGITKMQRYPRMAAAIAGVAGGRLDDGAARPQLALALRGLDHAQPDPILHRPARVQVLELGQHRRRQALGDPLQAHDRRVSDQVEHGGIAARHRRDCNRIGLVGVGPGQ
jgi:hypothetical protein